MRSVSRRPQRSAVTTVRSSVSPTASSLGVVDCFEAVDVHEGERGRFAGALGACDLGLDAAHARPARESWAATPTLVLRQRVDTAAASGPRSTRPARPTRGLCLGLSLASELTR